MLSLEQRQYLGKISPLASTISNWVTDKALWTKKKLNNTISPSLIIAHMIIESEWGTHPLAQDYHNNRYSNNLALLEVNDQWSGKVQKYGDKEYKAFSDWLHFATDYSDLVIFNPDYNRLISANTLADQIMILSSIKNDANYHIKLETLIEIYDL